MRLYPRILLPVAAALLLAGCGAGTTASPDSKNGPRHHVMIQVMNTYVHPATARVTAGGTVSWASYTSEYGAGIFFASDAVEALGCDELRPNWSQVAGGVLSLPLSRSSGIDDIRWPCPLRPGSYAYEVRLFESMEMGGLSNPQRRASGRITVE